MKNTRSILYLISLSFSIPLPILKADTKQPTHNEMVDNLEQHLLQLSHPVNVSAEGIPHFLTSIYNDPCYLEFLPNNFSHLIQFLQQGKQLGQKRTYTQLVLRTFMNKIKAGSYVNAYAFNTLLETMPGLLDSYFTSEQEESTEELQQRINDLLYQNFLHKFTSFKTDPLNFLNGLSQDIVETVKLTKPKEVDSLHVEELRKTLLIFLEVSIQKLIWNPEDHKESWESVKNITHNLTNLFECKIITDQDDLNDLFRSLLERYCFFIDITSHELPLDFFESVHHDIKNNSLIFLELQELQEEMETKKDRLMRALNEGKEKVITA